MSHDILLKLILIGNSGTGKSSLLQQLCENRFNPMHDVTIGVEFGSKNINLNINNKKINCKLQIWDTAGQEAFRSICRSYYRGAAGAVLVFDLTNKQSFQDIRNWMTELEENSAITIQKILIGNKNDLHNKRQVTYEEASTYAKNNNLIYMETNSKNFNSVLPIFTNISENIYKNYYELKDTTLKIEGVREYNNNKYVLIKDERKCDEKINCCSIC